MFVKTASRSELKECYYAFFRPRGVFGYLIGIWSRLKDKRFTGVAFSHVGILLEDELGKLRLYDATKGEKTGFRHYFHKAYIFKIELTEKEKYHLKKYLLARKGSKYDNRGITSFIFPHINEDEFKDFCSELQKNGLVSIGKMKDCERIEPYEFYKAIRPKATFVGLIL